MELKLFVDEITVPEGKRICGCCEQTKDVTEFYKDGTDKDGNQRYRRDCKVCYNNSRIRARKATKASSRRK